MGCIFPPSLPLTPHVRSERGPTPMMQVGLALDCPVSRGGISSQPAEGQPWDSPARNLQEANAVWATSVGGVPGAILTLCRWLHHSVSVPRPLGALQLRTSRLLGSPGACPGRLWRDTRGGGCCEVAAVG